MCGELVQLDRKQVQIWDLGWVQALFWNLKRAVGACSAALQGINFLHSRQDLRSVAMQVSGWEAGSVPFQGYRFRSPVGTKSETF